MAGSETEQGNGDNPGYIDSITFMHSFHPLKFNRSKQLLIFGFVFTLFCVGIFVPLAHAATYYVDNSCTAYNGNGATTTCATSSGGAGPFNSIANMQSKSGGYAPGDQILLDRGETFREQLTVPSSGNASSPITFGAYGGATTTNPIIDGLNVVSSSSWTSTTTSISGSVTQANMRLSTATSTSFVDFSAAGTLTPYVGDQITIADSAGHHLVGYIKAAGTGETYGSQLLADPGMDNLNAVSWTNNATATILTSGCQSENCLQVTLTAAYGGVTRTLGSVTDGWLLRNSVYMKAGTEESFLSFNVGNASYSTIANADPNYDQLPTTWTQYILYATADSTASNFTQNYGGATSGDTSLFDTASAEQVLTPSATGVTIVSAAGGSNYNWTSMASGFNLNDPSGYTYTINSLATVSTLSLSSNPQQVFEDGSRLVAVSATTAMNPGTFWFNATSSLLYIRTREDNSPSGHTIEIGARPYAILMDNDQYITLNGLTLYGAQIAGLNLWDNDSGLAVNNCVDEWNYDNGLTYEDGRASTDNVTGLTIQNSIFRDNGGSGIGVAVNNATDWSITGNQLYSNAQLIVDASGTPFSDNEDQYWSGGMKILTGQSGGVNNIISNNLVYNNGITGVNGSEGLGIWSDTSSGWTIKYNLVYGNQGPGVFLEKNINSTAVYNVLYGNTLSTTVGPPPNDPYGEANLQVYSGSPFNSSGNLIANNTIYGGWWGIAVGNEGGSGDTSQSTNNVFRNNIVVGAANYNLYSYLGGDNDGLQGSGNVYDHNSFGPTARSLITWGVGNNLSTYSAWETATGNCGSPGCSDSVQSNPLFTDLSGSYSTSTDFTISSSSPTINSGLNLGTSYDMGLDPASTWPSNIILDNENSFGPGWDLGAYVYTQTSTPSISITTPLNLATVSSTVTVSASSSAVSPASIASVQFYLDGSPLGSAVTSSPYTINWNTGTATNASHTLYALATDNYSNTATSTSITVTVANQAVLSVPTSILSFSAVQGSTATSTQSVVVTNAGATSTILNWSASSTQTWLTFSPAFGSLVGNASTSASFIVNPTGLAIGTYNATATIADPNASSSPQYIPVSFAISTTGIGTTLFSPTGGTIATGTISVSASATSTVGISSVQFYLDGSPLGSAVTSSPYTISWDTTMASDGSHTLYSVATDNNSNIASSSEITITVDNTPPAVSITSPTSGATVSGATSIAASSCDAISGVSSVAFYLDGSLLGESASSPYSINWDTTQTSNASHGITAVATDGAGNATTSQAISVTVYNAPSVSSGGGGGVPQSAFIIVPTATSTTSSTTSASSTAFSSPLLVSTSTTPSTAIATSSLQAELNILLAELQSLKAQAGASSSNASSSYIFTTDLQLHDTGPAVNALQSYLIQEDTGPAAQRLKVHGTTDYFGILTYNALVEFQASVGIHATGYFGPITRAYVNAQR